MGLSVTQNCPQNSNSRLSLRQTLCDSQPSAPPVGGEGNSERRWRSRCSNPSRCADDDDNLDFVELLKYVCGKSQIENSKLSQQHYLSVLIYLKQGRWNLCPRFCGHPKKLNSIYSFSRSISILVALDANDTYFFSEKLKLFFKASYFFGFFFPSW